MILPDRMLKSFFICMQVTWDRWSLCPCLQSSRPDLVHSQRTGSSGERGLCPLLRGFCLQSGGTGVPGGTEVGYSRLWHRGDEGLLCSGSVWFPCGFSLWSCLPREGGILGRGQVEPLTGHVNLAETPGGYLVLQLNHDRRLGSKCKKGSGQ